MYSRIRKRWIGGLARGIRFISRTIRRIPKRRVVAPAAFRRAYGKKRRYRR